MVQQKCQEETTNSEIPLKGANEPQGVKISVGCFKVNRESLNRLNPQMTLKPVPIFGRSQVTSSIVITMNLEFNSACRRKKHSPFHWNTLTWRGTTDTDLDVMQKKKRIDDCWNVDSNKHLSDSWKGFTKFTLLKERRGLQKDTRRPWKDWQKCKRLPDQIMCGQKFWRKLVQLLGIERNRNGQKKKPKLENARRLRGIYFIDPDDEEHKRNYQKKKTRGENWKELWLQSCRAKDNRASRKWLRSRKSDPRRVPKQCLVV